MRNHSSLKQVPRIDRLMLPSLDWSGFVPELIATFIGAGIGFATAMLWDRKKTETEIKHMKNRMINAIIEELKVIQIGLSDPKHPFNIKWDKSIHGFTGEYATMSIPAYESAINSGNFSLLPPALQTRVGNAYIEIQWSISLTDQILKFYSTSVYTHSLADTEATTLINHLQLRISKSLARIKEVMPELEVEIRK